MVRSSIILSLLLAATPALAKSKGGVTMPDVIQVNGKKLTLNGLGIREATMLNVDVYVAGLYLEKPTKNPKEIINSDQTKKLVLFFVRDVDREDMVNAWIEGFEKNDGKGLKKQLDQLNSMMSGINEGQRLTLTYIPGTGTRVGVDGKTRGTIKGEQFARVMFSIFVGPQPPNEGLKQGLLGAAS